MTTPPPRADVGSAAPYDSSRTRSQNADAVRGIIDPAFDRDKFLMRQKVMSINEKYFVYDEAGAPLIFIERPRHLLRNLGAALLGFIAGIIAMVVFGGASTALGETTTAGTLLAILSPMAFFATFLVVAMGLSKKRHISFHRGDAATGEKLMECKQEKKFEIITSTYTLRDAKGRALAMFRKNFLYNIFRRRWQVKSIGGTTIALAKEDSIIKSLLRRVLGPMMGLLRTNYVIMHPNGTPQYGAFNRTFTILDRYVLDLGLDRERKLDRRVALALGVLLDTGERR